jgi:hypothetical protein
MLRILSTAALGLGLAASFASPALALAPERLAVHVPFAFSVADETLPAGDYSISPLSDVDRDVLEIRSADGRKAVLVGSEDGEPASRTSKPELVFDRYGNQEFLHAIRLPEETGAVLTASEAELQAVRAQTVR